MQLPLGLGLRRLGQFEHICRLAHVGDTNAGRKVITASRYSEIVAH
jgi:hypothetical protein